MLTSQRKSERIARAKRHAAADMLVAGNYWHDGKGCSVGCDAYEIAGQDVRRGYHAVVAAHDGTPEWLERLRDVVFEGLAPDKRAWWHVTLAEALPVEVEWQPYYHRIMARIVRMPLRYADQWDAAFRQQVVGAVEEIARLHDESSMDPAAWNVARSTAWGASREAAHAVWSASGKASSACSAAEIAESAAWSTVWAASSSAECAAKSVAWSSAKSDESDAWRDATRAAYNEIADIVIAELAPPPS